MKDQVDTGTKWFIAIVAVVLAVGGALSAVFWTDLAGAGNTQDSFSATVANVMLMIGALLALPLALWSRWVAEPQLKASRETVEKMGESLWGLGFTAAQLR